MSGSYFLLVVPLKFLIVMSEMVSLEGNYRGEEGQHMREIEMDMVVGKGDKRHT